MIGLAILGGTMAAIRLRRRGRVQWRHAARSRWVAAPPERVFDVVGDPRKAFLTDNPIASMEVVGEQTEGVGTIYRWSFRLPFGFRWGFDEVVTAWEPGRRFAYQATTGWDMKAGTRLEPEAGGTRVTFTIDYRLPGPWISLPIPRWLESLGVDRALAGIARRAEGTEDGWFALPREAGRV